MKTDIEAISPTEADRRQALETIVRAGQRTFIEVGEALLTLRDERLYRSDYGTFEAYCKAEFGWTASRARQLVASARVAKSVTIVTVPNEASARELGKIDPSQRAEVVQEIVDSGKPLTALEIKRRLPPPPMRPSGTSPTDRTSGTSDADGRPMNDVPHLPPPPPPGPVLDATGWPIPTQLIPLWQRSGEVQELLTILSRVKGALRTAQDNRDILFAEVNFSSAQCQLGQAWTDVKTAKPFAVCPACQGQVPDQCTLCHGRGFISEYRWNTVIPREDKEFRSKAIARGKR